VERLTEATSSATIHAIPDISTLHSGSEAVTARAFADVAEAVPRVGRILDLTLRHHIEAVRRYFEAAGAGVNSQSAFELGVGFVDLSGYTSTSLTVGLPELGTLVGDFEARVTDVISEQGGRLVKFVGDAVLFVSHDPDTLARMAVAIVQSDDRDGALSARGALTHGLVLARDGDYFGPSVNLAARLVSVAPERGILVDEALRALLDPERWTFVDQPAVDLKGIDQPVAAALLLRR
jgi:class 3 adenylate cyclase